MTIIHVALQRYLNSDLIMNLDYEQSLPRLLTMEYLAQIDRVPLERMQFSLIVRNRGETAMVAL